MASYCEEEDNRKVWQDIARKRPTESCGRILRGGVQQKVWQVIARRRPTESFGRILRGRGQQKVVAGYCEEEANKSCVRIFGFVFTCASTENYKLELCRLSNMESEKVIICTEISYLMKG